MRLCGQQPASFGEDLRRYAADPPLETAVRSIMSKRGASGNDSKFFSTTKKGETHELKTELANPDKNKKKDAVKKVIANMTVGKDVSM